MSRLLREEDVINTIKSIPEGNWANKKYIQEIKKVPTAQQWIPCNEMLPEIGVAVLVDSDLGVMTGWRDGELWFGYRPCYDPVELIVYAWMSMPEPYKPEEA